MESIAACRTQDIPSKEGLGRVGRMAGRTLAAEVLDGGCMASRLLAPVLAGLLAAVPPAWTSPTPTELVHRFYDHVGLERDPAARAAFTDPAKTVLDEADRLRKSEGADCLDPNMALDAPTYDRDELAKSLKMVEAVSGDEARVVVAFTVSGEARRMQWMLRKVDGAWKVADILSVTGEWALSQYHCE